MAMQEGTPDGRAAMTRPGRTVGAEVDTFDGGRWRRAPDQLATEEPLEIRLDAGGEVRKLAVTMRTPGADFDLAVGFLHGEGVIGGPDDVRTVAYCLDRSIEPEQRYNVVTVKLAGAPRDLTALDRHFTTTSACGVCGKASLDAIRLRGCAPVPPGPALVPELLTRLPGTLAESQGVFRKTGGLHAAALFDPAGNLLAIREDVGRHNAVDKLIGWALMQGMLPLHDRIVVVSGRSSYEIVQKCLVAGVPVVCAVSAPSSLAVGLAREWGMTLVGFLRGERFNVYAGQERIVG
jgi:FdhD protein